MGSKGSGPTVQNVAQTYAANPAVSRAAKRGGRIRRYDSGGQTTQNVAQTYTANPAIGAAAGQALSGAQAAASQPFQMPVAPVAGFSNDQQSAFNQYRNLAGPNSYLNTAAGYAGQAATPITANDVNQYYNPMADNVTKQLQNIYGEQNSQNQGMLTAQAGGVGADRIAVGMGDLANQQGLASGQVYSQLYQQALQAAQQQKQMQASAAGQFGQFEQGALGATGALNAAGTQEQQQKQAELNAPYQRKLAQIAYQFQTPQYLAAIAGGLAPALGGSTYGNQVTTPPQPSMFSQIAGLGTAGVGLAGAFGAFGGSGNGTSGGWAGPSSVGGAPLSASGGRIENYDDGGGVDPMLQFPGASVPKIGGPEAIPMIPLQSGAGHSGMGYGQGIQFAQPQQKSDSGSGIGSDIASALGAVAKIVPFLKQGGGIPHYDSGGDINPYPPPPMDDIPAATEPTGSGFGAGLGRVFSGIRDWANKSDPEYKSTTPAPAADFSQRFPKPDESLSNPLTGHIPLPSARPNPGENLEQMERHPGKRSGSGGGGGHADALPAAAEDSGFNAPYPDALNRDAGQNATRSPWMALVQAGAAMASTPGPLGVSLGKGMLAGTAALDKQRTELRSEQELNDKAQQLYQQAQQHLMKYKQGTWAERADVALRSRELNQKDADGTTGTPVKFTAMDYNRAAQYVMQLHPGVQDEAQLQPLIEAEVGRRKRILAGMAGAAAAPTSGTAATPDQISMIKAAIRDGKATKESAIAGAAGKGIHVDPALLE